jgi:hypothetical protein
MKHLCLVVSLVWVVGCLGGSGLLPQATAAETGWIALDQAIRDLDCGNVVMCLAAHPECVEADTLAYLRMKQGVEVAVVLAGWEQVCGHGDECAGLSAVPVRDRAREIISAAERLGWQVYTLDIAEGAFDPELATENLVRLIREIQPDTILTRHAKEQVCATCRGMRIVGEETFRLAANEDAFPEQIAEGVYPWQVTRFFERTRHQSNPVWEYDVAVPVGEFDVVRGKTYAGMARAAWPFCTERSQAVPEDTLAYYRVVALADGEDKDSKLLPDRDRAAVLRECFQGWKARRAIGNWDSALRWLQDISPEDRSLLERGLRKADKALADLESLTAKQPDAFGCGAKGGASPSDLRRELQRAIAETVGLETRIVRSPEKVWPGAEFEVVVSTGYRWEGPLYDFHVEPVLPAEVKLVSLTADERFVAPIDTEASEEEHALPRIWVEELAPNTVVKATFRFRVSEDAQFEAPGDEEYAGVGDKFLSFLTAFRLDSTRGLLHESETPAPVYSVPEVTVEAVPETPLLLYGEGKEIMVQVRVTNHGNERWPRSFVALRPPEGFSISRQEIPRVTLLPSETASVAFWVRPESVEPGVCVFRGMVVYGVEEGQTYRETDPERLANAVVETQVAVADIKPPQDVKVGLIRTCGDVLENALEALEVPYSVLEPDEVSAADLGRWDVIIVDAGAYSKRPDVKRHYKRFLRYLWRGGHMVVMGHRPEGWDHRYPPYPITISSQPLGVGEGAVAFLAPDHALVQSPNQLRLSDFEGWSGLWGSNFPQALDQAYTRLLSVQASGLPEGFTGGYVVAKYGYGSYIYTGFDWERQLKASHVGAYRAFANMIAYPNYREDAESEETSPATEKTGQ